MPRGHPTTCILFHPDYDRRLWNLTRSAVTPEEAARGLGAIPPTAGGELRPALRISGRCRANMLCARIN